MTEKRTALIVANSQFKDRLLRNLVGPPGDAKALSRVLVDPAIGDFEVQSLFNEPSYKVRVEIESFFTDRKRDDLLLFYFSGHGVKDEGGMLYLVTTDTNLKLLRSTAVGANFISDVMLRSRSRRQVLLLDCCYSGAFARGMVAKGNSGSGLKEELEGS